MKRRDLIPIAAFLLLQACQYNNTVPDAKKSTSNEAALYNTQLGLAYLKQGDRPRAKHKLLKALAEAPHSPEVNTAMAWFMEQSGEINNAQRYYRKAMMVAPKQGAPLNNYGAFLCRKGHYREADAYFIKAFKDPNYERIASAYENAGLCAEAIHDDQKAIAYFRKALEHDPSRQQSLNELATIEVRLGHKIGVKYEYTNNNG